ncbi:hypothetical protein TNCV_157261 [Trichonephila clavipes]|nr:hypothetical protein TNCV_157261 [Trichonephila clavipes]
MRSPSSAAAAAAFEQGTGINLLIPPSSVWCCHWPCVATWLMEVGGVSDAGTNGVEEGRLGEPSLPMEWVLGVSIDSILKIVVAKIFFPRSLIVSFCCTRIG